MRRGSQSLKVSKWLSEQSIELGMNSGVIDLNEEILPVFDDETVPENWKELSRKLEESDCFIFVSPEWDGMMSQGLINLYHYIGRELAHKPVMLVGVSSGRGGAYPISQMKQLGQKNKHFVISPENLIVGGVKEMLNDQELDTEKSDYTIKKRAIYCLKVLNKYAEALKPIREEDFIKNTEFTKGV